MKLNVDNFQHQKYLKGCSDFHHSFINVDIKKSMTTNWLVYYPFRYLCIGTSLPFWKSHSRWSEFALSLCRTVSLAKVNRANWVRSNMSHLHIWLIMTPLCLVCELLSAIYCSVLLLYLSWVSTHLFFFLPRSNTFVVHLSICYQ